MRTELVSQQENLLHVRVEEDKEVFAERVARAVRELASELKIKGFRKGKAPRRILELYVGREAIYERALEGLVEEAFKEVVSSLELKLMDRPRVRVVQAEEGKDFVCEFELSVFPEVELPELKDVQVERKRVELDEVLLERLLEALRHRFGREAKQVDRPARMGDVVELKVELEVSLGEDDGFKVDRERSFTDFLPLEEGSPRFVLESLGRGKGESYALEVDPKLFGLGSEVRARAKVEVLGVYEIVLQDWPELAKGLGFSDKEALVEAVREQFPRIAEGYERSRLAGVCLREVVEASKVEVPQRMVQERVEARVEGLRKELAEKGTDLIDYLLSQGTNMEDYRRSLEEGYRRSLKEYFVVEALGDKMGINPSDRDLNVELYLWASEMGVPYQTVVRTLNSKPKEELQGYLGFLSDRAKRRLLAFALVDAVAQAESREVDEAYLQGLISFFLENFERPRDVGR